MKTEKETQNRVREIIPHRRGFNVKEDIVQFFTKSEMVVKFKPSPDEVEEIEEIEEASH